MLSVNGGASSIIVEHSLSTSVAIEHDWRLKKKGKAGVRS